MDLTLVFFLLMLLFLLTELLFPILIPISMAGGCFCTGIFHMMDLNWFWLILVFVISTALTFQLGKMLSNQTETLDE